MKSAAELAMEKANKVSGSKLPKLTDSQKEAIAEIRRVTKAKIAERKIYLDEKLSNLPDGPAETKVKDTLLKEYNDIKEKIEADMQADIEKVKVVQTL
jgi:hypothetical protein